MDEATVKVTLSQTVVPKVEFEGDWTRRDIDTAYKCMLRELLNYNMKRREQCQKTQTTNQ